MKSQLSFPHYVQLDAMDCCSTCLRIIAKYYGKTYKYNANKFFSKYEMNVSDAEVAKGHPGTKRGRNDVDSMLPQPFW